VDRILDWLIPSSRLRHRDFWALRQVSFSIPKGVSVGIIGANGAGKSTLLKIISGTTKPTSGNVSVEGKVAALLELGMGFHTEFTGRQNIRMNGRLLGLGEEELEAKIPQIIAFSELGDFIDQPLRTYSSGMFVRLGFSVVASVEPDILIIDEALSVGDTHFQQKCIRRIREFHEQGATLLFVSHDPGAVKTLCQEAILLDDGEIISRGAPDDILDHYNALIARKSVKGAGFHIARLETSRKNIITRHSGNFMALITDAAMLNEKGERISAAVAGETVKIYVRVIFVTEAENPTIGLLIKDRLGLDVFGTNTYMLGEKMGTFGEGEALDAIFSLKLDIGCGEYTLTAAAHTLESHLYECYDWADKILNFTVIPSNDFKFVGVSKLYPTFTHHTSRATPDEAWSLLEDIFHDAPDALTMAPASQRYLCYGWYEPEATESGYIRWTDKDFAFFLRPDGKQLAIEMACPKPDISTHPLMAEVSANNEKIFTLTIDRKEPQVVQIPLPERLTGKLSMFSISLNKSWSPADYSNTTDHRQIGVVIKRIWTT
jgi:lipopolysaccharide transport system ATP-binding protein